jgi:pyruvate dehydrogenase E2 component (dihydrolipoamide acetyltransferase)
VETDKAVVEIPSPWSGNVAKLVGEPGDVVEIGADLVVFDGEARTDAGAVVGELPEPEYNEETSASEPAASRETAARASPAVRQLARETGVDLEEISGSGPGGAITTQDVRAQAGAGDDGFSVERISGVRRAMEKTMSRSASEVVPATVTEEADIDDWAQDTDVTLRLVRAIEVGVSVEPGLNTWFHAQRRQRWLHKAINLGIAMDTPEGLFAPVLRDTAAHSDEALRENLRQLRADVLERKVSTDALRGQTITLSNFGMIAGLHAALVVVPPQVAILGAGRIVQRVVIIDGKAVARAMLPVSLTFDHRVVTGGEAARFLAAVVSALEQKSHRGDST